jgi:hypothetical protein
MRAIQSPYHILLSTSLGRLAREAAIPDFRKLSKEQLFMKLQERFDMDRLMRTEARREKIETLRD